MFKKLASVVLAGFMLVNLCGCIAVAAGLAETQKVKQNINVSYSQALDVVKATMQAQGIHFEKAEINEHVSQVKGKLVDGDAVRIYISKVSDNESAIAVRVGTSESGMDEARGILEGIVLSANQASPSQPPDNLSPAPDSSSANPIQDNSNQENPQNP